jgi:hypothetical protein
MAAIPRASGFSQEAELVGQFAKKPKQFYGIFTVPLPPALSNALKIKRFVASLGAS